MLEELLLNPLYGDRGMQFPPVVVAHRWQTWLLVTALLALVVTGFLVFDLTRNLRTVVISETNRSLENAVKELAQEGSSLAPPGESQEALDVNLKRTSYEVLHSIQTWKGGICPVKMLLDIVFRHIQSREARLNSLLWSTPKY